jgi:hypothetical protein
MQDIDSVRKVPQLCISDAPKLLYALGENGVDGGCAAGRHDAGEQGAEGKSND